MSYESPLLPSPNTPQKPVIPNESILYTFRKLWVLRWMSEGSLRFKKCVQRIASKGGETLLCSFSFTPQLKLTAMAVCLLVYLQVFDTIRLLFYKFHPAIKSLSLFSII